MSASNAEQEFSSLFCPEPVQAGNGEAAEDKRPWKVLLVDDEADIHAVLHLALDGMAFEGRPVQLLDANSSQEARALLQAHPDVAVVLLDVVMESSDAGLSLVRHVRHELRNRLVQILLITGQPGYAPPHDVVVDYEINGFRLKSELSTERIFVSVYTAIRTHAAMRAVLEQQRLRDEAERLAQHDRRLKAFIVESTADAIISLSLDDRISSWNQSATRILGYTAEEMLGHPLYRIIPAERQAESRSLVESVSTGASISPFELQFRRRDGRLIDAFVTLSPIRELDDSIVGISMIARDITERKQIEARLRLAANVFAHAREAIVITDLDGIIVDVNDSFSRITGYTPDEALGQNPRILKSGLQPPAIYSSLWRELLEKGHWHGELWNRRKSGEIYASAVDISTVCDELGRKTNYVALSSDVTATKRHEEQLERMAHYDALTGLPNRSLLADRLKHSMAAMRRSGNLLGVVYLDLDGFKAVNDQHGHEMGDLLLLNVATRMKSVLRDCDTLSRFGGDEFVAVFPELACVEDCLPLLKRLLGAVSLPVQADVATLQVSASLGVTFYPQADNVEADQLIRQADQAMYQAKLAGKNRYHAFDAEQDATIRYHHESQERIRLALSQREFVLHYQPKVNMQTGAVIGAEALIRWQHPEKGVLPPSAFLPVIEDHMLAIDIGEWVIDAALTQIERWRLEGLELPVSVNVGARQLQDVAFVERLQTLIDRHPAIRAGDLSLEVLETSALEQISRVSETIQACQNMGVAFALDDFGTGYSSLTYLKHLPVSTLKVDQSFVRDMLNDPDDLAILEGVLGLARAFDKDVIAEGVETEAHGCYLLQLGCKRAQGYGIARPMPAGEMRGWRANWRTCDAWAASSASANGDLSRLHLEIKHRAWIAHVERYLRGEHRIPPSQDHTQCAVGRWLLKDGLSARVSGEFHRLHRQTHELAAELLSLHESGLGDEALARIGELHALRDALLDNLPAPAAATR